MSEMTDDTTVRTFVLGLDGVPWHLLSSWVDDGQLPNFSRLFNEGAVGPLESTMPHMTPLAWPSIATGVGPDKHGIYFFSKLNGDYTTRAYTSNDLNQPPIWEILSPSVTANVPMTYPAQEVDGTIITGMMSPQFDERCVHPPSMFEEIQNRIPEYDIGLKWSEYGDREEAFLTDLESRLEARRELMRYLMEIDDWELFFFVYTEPDRLQHLIWDDDVLLSHYQRLDDILGEVLEYISNRDANLFVVSDHGFGPISKFICVNSILESNGYLRRKENKNARKVFDSVGFDKDMLERTMKRFGVEDVIRDLLPRSVIDRVAEQVPGDSWLYDVEFSETKAFCYGTGLVYIHDQERFENGVVAPSERSSVKEELIATFHAFNEELKEDGLEIADGNDVFPTDDAAPDLVVEGINGFEVNPRLSDEPIVDTGDMTAGHRKEGIVLAWGDEIASTRIRDASVYDIAPTILHSLGKPIQEHTDGQVLDVFEPSSRPTKAEITKKRYVTTETETDYDEDFTEVEERLRGLGYVE